MLISEATDVMRVMGDPLRARIIEILADGPACVCHLVQDTGAKQPNVSGHLRQLRQTGLVVAEPQWRYTYYRLVPDALEAAAGRLARIADQARVNADTRRPC